ncbi:MAG: 4-(cytidine 5'-diphospho)-2-C-methyl-D-erythritol kinase [Deltaproteobacteria bacterium]|nr:4-(cytidine 5'-diphospho)-2-C-methyl-D-erythritol kinase [Deltaproteobacteria bacterium]
MKVVKFKSPAKINVRLDVISNGSDGSHDLEAINAPVSIFDDIECSLTEKGIQVICENDADVPSGEENIVYGVAKEILAYSNKNVGVNIRIKKNIPSSAGMGGSSSNAATVIMGLNELLKINLSKEKLMKIGLRFGADVPFFVMGGAAVSRNHGGQLSKIKKMPKLPLVIITPNVKVPPKWAFEKFVAANDNQPKEQPETAIPLQFATKKAIMKFLHNDLETVTTQRFPVVNELKSILKKTGALACQMTGSGPSVFGIFPNKIVAEIACNKIKSKISDCRIFLAENIN